MGYLVTYLVYIAVILRAVGWNYDTSPIPTVIWALLAIYGVVLFSQQPLTRRFPLYPRLYILIQTGLAISMLYSAPTIDFLVMLFLPMCFQVVWFFPNWIGFTWIGFSLAAAAGIMLFALERQVWLTMILTGAGLFFLTGSFAYLIRRTEQSRHKNKQLFAELQEAYRQLKDSAAQEEKLAAATERHRMVRELHDSLTQTLFSMNLAVQSAQFAVSEDPTQAEEHLIRVQSLARNAAGEVQALTGQVSHRLPVNGGGLASALQKLADERREQQGLTVKLEIVGQRLLPEAVEANLYRITQEALSNITRHAGVDQALVQLRLESPLASLVVADEGCGFNRASVSKTGRFGLLGIAERAAEIGWRLDIQSQPGHGTLLRVEERPA